MCIRDRCGGVCGYAAAIFSNLAGGTVEHIGTSIRAELPPKIVLPKMGIRDRVLHLQKRNWTVQLAKHQRN